MEGVSFEPCRVHLAIEEIVPARVCDLVLVLNLPGIVPGPAF